MTPEQLGDRVAARISVNESGCWLWTGACTAGGYGQVRINGRHVYLHRHAYLELVGSIPEGFEVDHLCRVTRCCNPTHLEPVTPEENKRRCRQEFCFRGHDLSDAHVLKTGPQAGRRQCRTCNLERMRKYAAARRLRLRQGVAK